MRQAYRGHHIERTHDVPTDLGGATWVWEWWHPNYDGAPDAHDRRMGYGVSLQDAVRQIDNQLAGRDADDDGESAPERR